MPYADPEKRAAAKREWTRQRGLAQVQAHVAKRRARRLLLREKVQALKSVPCMDCEQTFPPVCMDFDHRPDETKLFDVGGELTRMPDRLIMAEIEKCDVVCANCHRIRTDARTTRIV